MRFSDLMTYDTYTTAVFSGRRVTGSLKRTLSRHGTKLERMGMLASQNSGLSRADTRRSIGTEDGRMRLWRVCFGW